MSKKKDKKDKTVATKANTPSSVEVSFNIKYILGIVLVLLVVIIAYFMYNEAAPGCNDSDGRSYYKYGVVTLDGDKYKDKCISETHLKEYYCSNNVTKEDIIFCEHGCVDGKCLEQTTYCGGRFNISCEEGLECDYKEAKYLSELGTCKKRVSLETPLSKSGNYSYLCYIPDSGRQFVTFFLKKQMMYYVTNAGIQKILVPIGSYMNDPTNVTSNWALRLAEDIKDNEFLERLFAIRIGRNALGNITCYPVEKIPPYFQEFIDNHPFLYSRLKQAS